VDDDSSSSDKKNDSSSSEFKDSSSSSSYEGDGESHKDEGLIAKDKGYGAWDDTVSLNRAGSEFTLEAKNQDEFLTLARGNKFTILNGEKGTFVSDNSRYVSVNKKGVVKAKRHYGRNPGVSVSYRDAITGDTITIHIRVWEQVLFNTRVSKDNDLLYNVGAKKLKMNTEVDRTIDFSSTILLNSEFANPLNDGVIDELKMEVGDDGRYHVMGETIKKGTVKIPYTVYGKKFKVVIKVK